MLRLPCLRRPQESACSVNEPTWKPAPKVFTLDGEPLDLADFVVVNDLEPEQVNAIGAMEPGDEMTFGGGAGALFVLRRVS